MKFFRPIIIAGLCFLPTAALAATFSLPPKAPSLVNTIPDVLEPVDTIAGAEGASKETREFYVDLEPLKALDLKAATDESLANLDQQHGISIDPESLKQQEGQINGISCVDLSFSVISGKEKSSLTLISPKPGIYFVLLEFGSEEWLGKNDDIVKSIRESIHAVK